MLLRPAVLPCSKMQHATVMKVVYVYKYVSRASLKHCIIIDTVTSRYAVRTPLDYVYNLLAALGIHWALMLPMLTSYAARRTSFY